MCTVQTPAVKFVELIFRNNVWVIHRKTYPNENYSGSSPLTSPNSSNIQDDAGSSVLRCTLWTY